MSTDVMWRIGSTSSKGTEKLGRQLGHRLKGGEFIELVSDLGGGKTTFVRGLAAGMGSSDKVASPSFTIRRDYRSKDLNLYHFDFYRLDESGLIANDLAEVIDQPDNVVVVEWADVVKNVVPNNRLTIDIKVTGENSRQLEFKAPSSLDYLLKGLK